MAVMNISSKQIGEGTLVSVLVPCRNGKEVYTSSSQGQSWTRDLPRARICSLASFGVVLTCNKLVDNLLQRIMKHGLT